MSEKPILFSGDMIKAIFEGRKTQTRRVMKPQPVLMPGEMKIAGRQSELTAYWHWKDEWWWADPQQSTIDKCPYGKAGDYLWVRETWRTFEALNNTKPSAIPNLAPIQYKADMALTRGSVGVYAKWRPSIYMPRWASRLTLLVLEVRVERLQDITSDDCIAEGIDHNWLGDNCPPEYQDEWRNYYVNEDGPPCYSARDSFMSLWDSINAKRGYRWSTNPWVWVINFEVVKND